MMKKQKNKNNNMKYEDIKCKDDIDEKAEEIELEKDGNGFIKPKAELDEEGNIDIPEIAAEQNVQMVNKFLEKSNVNPVEELILTLEHQRNYETHVKFIDLAKQMDEGGASLMRVPD